MTVQEQQTWGQDWQTVRPASARRPLLSFDTWKPLFLTPRLIAYTNRPGRRSWFVFGGCGFMLLFGFLYALAAFTVAMVVLEWDMFVFVAYGLTWFCVRPVQKLKSRRAARVAA